MRRGFFPAASHRAPAATAPSTAATTRTSHPASAVGSPQLPPPANPHDAQGPVSELQSNSQLVYELIHNPAHQLSDEDAVGAWRRAGGFVLTLSQDLAATAAEGAVLRSSGFGNGLMRYDADEVSLQPLDESELGLLQPEELLRLVRERAKVMTERVFWDGLVLQLCDGLTQGAFLRAVSSSDISYSLLVMGGHAGTCGRASCSRSVSTTSVGHWCQMIVLENVGRMCWLQTTWSKLLHHYPS